MSETNTKTNYPPVDIKMKNAGALWIRESKKDGTKYLSLQVEIKGKKYNILGFSNKFFDEDPTKQPKYRLSFTDETYHELIAVKPETQESVAQKPKTVKTAAINQVESDDIF